MIEEIEEEKFDEYIEEKGHKNDLNEILNQDVKNVKDIKK